MYIYVTTADNCSITDYKLFSTPSNRASICKKILIITCVYRSKFFFYNFYVAVKL